MLDELTIVLWPFVDAGRWDESPSPDGGTPLRSNPSGVLKLWTLVLQISAKDRLIDAFGKCDSMRVHVDNLAL